MYLTSYCLKLIYVIDIFYTLRFLLVLAIFFLFFPSPIRCVYKK